MSETVKSLREKVNRQLEALAKLAREVTVLTGENEANLHVRNFEGGPQVVIQVMAAVAKKEI